jgi:hypothetical protein
LRPLTIMRLHLRSQRSVQSEPEDCTGAADFCRSRSGFLTALMRCGARRLCGCGENGAVSASAHGDDEDSARSERQPVARRFIERRASPEDRARFGRAWTVPDDGAAGQHKSGQRERELSGLWSAPWGVFQATLACISPPRGSRPHPWVNSKFGMQSPRAPRFPAKVEGPVCCYANITPTWIPFLARG